MRSERESARERERERATKMYEVTGFGPRSMEEDACLGSKDDQFVPRMQHVKLRSVAQQELTRVRVEGIPLPSEEGIHSKGSRSFA